MFLSFQESSESQPLPCSASTAEDSPLSLEDLEGGGFPDDGQAQKSNKHPATVTLSLPCDSKGHLHLVIGGHSLVLWPSSRLSAHGIWYFLSHHCIWSEVVVAAEQFSLCCQEDAGEGQGGKLSLLYAQEDLQLLPSLA